MDESAGSPVIVDQFLAINDKALNGQGFILLKCCSCEFLLLAVQLLSCLR
jgi:hypothetical protein